MESAKRQFVELYGSALVMNTYLKIALVLVSLVALGLLALNFHTAARYSQVKPLVVRIDEVGRAEAVVVRRFALSAATAGAAVLPDAVRREALQPHPFHASARVSGFAVLPESGAGGRDDRPERSEPRARDVRDEPLSRRDRGVGSERQPERAWDAALQGGRDVPEGLLHTRYAVTKGTAKPTSRRSTSSCAITCQTSSSV